MTQLSRRTTLIGLTAYLSACANQTAPIADVSKKPQGAAALSAMKRATSFMTDTVAFRGGYVWAYLPDLSRRWGEMEARPTMLWVQPPGTATMGHAFLDAYHATGDEQFWRAAVSATRALIAAQHAAGGWNYIHDFAGEASLRDWYATIGANGWRLEEFQHYYGNATFDDAGTSEASQLMLRMHLERKSDEFRPPLEKAIAFVLDSQYPIGAWPQRYPLMAEFTHHGKPDYTSYPTFNDDVAGENIDFLLKAYQALGDRRLLDAITRGMNAFLVTQQAPPQPGWALQYTPDLKPVGARTYEPDALTTHTSARNVELLIEFYQLTGDTKFLARAPEAIDWLEKLALPPAVAPVGRTHPTFIELGTNRPLYVHREGSNVVNGRYYVDYDSRNTLAHYSAFRQVNVADLRRRLSEAKASSPAALAKASPLATGPGLVSLPRYFAVDVKGKDTAANVIASLNASGYWTAPLGYNSHPYKGDGSKTPAPGDYSRTHVGDETDTSPYPDPKLTGISVEAYVRNMSVLIRQLDASH
jgi:hypothetical protein